MHQSSLEHMERLVGQYLSPQNPLTVIDIGSFDVNGSYKPFFEHPNWQYIGIDLEPGNNVDVVLESSYKLPFESGTIDLVISGQAFEHIKFFWLTWAEMVRVLKPGGQIFLIAPSRGPEHRYPVDCWRFYPDGFRSLAEYSNMEALEVLTDWTSNYSEASSQWGDTVGVFRKPMDHRVEPDAKTQRLQKELRQARKALAVAQGRIEAMETSKFWLLRASWIRAKKLLGLGE